MSSEQCTDENCSAHGANIRRIRELEELVEQLQKCITELEYELTIHKGQRPFKPEQGKVLEDPTDGDWGNCT